MLSAFLKSAFFLGISFAVATANAVTLDWDTVAWANGTLTHAYDVDPASAGNDVTVTVSGNTGQLGQELVAPNPQTPALTKNLQGGLATTENTLTLLLDVTNQAQSVTITVNFSATYVGGVKNVSFTIFDVDFANQGAGNAQFQDELRSIVGVALDGSLVAATITTSANNTLSGSGLTQKVDGTATTVDTGAGSGASNVTISFGATAIKSFSFVYGSGSGTVANPTAQHIGIHDLTFTPVPELNPAWSGLASCLVAIGLVFRHHANVRRK